MKVRLGLLALALAWSPAAGAADSDVKSIPIAQWSAPATWEPGPNAGSPASNSSTARTPLAVLTPALPFFAVTPCRIADTRGGAFSGAFGPPALVAGVVRNFPIANQCSIPSNAQAVSLNLTVVNPAGQGNLIVYPQGGTVPNTSTLNYSAGQVAANAAIVPLGSGGMAVIAAVSATDLIIDVNGYYAPSGSVAGLRWTSDGSNGTSTSDNVTIGGSLTVSGTVTAANFTSTGAGQWTTGAGGAIYYNGGSVGIGTPSPASPFDVNGAATVRGAIYQNDTSSWRIGTNADGAHAGMWMVRNIYTGYQNGLDSANGNTYLSMNGGNVGIGTTTPSRQAHIYGFGQAVNTGITDAGNKGGALYLQDSGGSAYNGGTLLFGAYFGHFAGIHAELRDGGGNSAGDLSFETRNAVGDAALTPRLFIAQGGNVGIGTTSPSAPLSLGTALGNKVALYDVGSGTGYGFGIQPNLLQIFAYSVTDRVGIGYGGSSGAFNETLTIKGGNVGIGKPNPLAQLDVAGSINATGTITGVIHATYQDVAEWVPAREPLRPGTVVVVDGARTNGVVPSRSAYDTRVAGVVSASPGVILGEEGTGKAKVATTGRVSVRVNAAEPIEVGDLLVTSSVEGVAMKSIPLSLGGVLIHRPGTLIGKALEPLSKGEGEILVLLSLQ